MGFYRPASDCRSEKESGPASGAAKLRDAQACFDSINLAPDLPSAAPLISRPESLFFSVAFARILCAAPLKRRHARYKPKENHSPARKALGSFMSLRIHMPLRRNLHPTLLLFISAALPDVA
jgi:hypothetical protein